MRLVYGFNHGEAIRAFDEAARLDPGCAVCHWGAALAYGPHVNAPMDSAGGVAAWAELQQAVALESKATERERAYIDALRARYSASAPGDRASLDSAYARAMADVVRRYPDDLDAATLYAESLMDLSPWNYWTKDGKPRPQTEIIVAQLERVIRIDPKNPGACHYYIHAVEASEPQKAIPCAERLAAMMPGEGHMVHMPAHIYIRVGRYADAIDANVHAVHADESYIAAEQPQGLYPIGYYPHNYHFLAFAAAMAGRSQTAIDAARALSGKVNMGVARQLTGLQQLVAYYPLMLVTFRRWDDVLAAPQPPADMRYATGLVDYARGAAFAARSDWDRAGVMLDSVRAIASATGASDQTAMTTGADEDKTAMMIAVHALSGEIARYRGRLDEAVMHFREAARLEDGFNYAEPPQWYFPVRHALGETLLAGKRPAEAEAVYREDLARFPENGWALRGLSQALYARGARAEAAAVDARLKRAWAGSDIVMAMTKR
jgi:tetratricopeptide (TPR) repeat protein